MNTELSLVLSLAYVFGPFAFSSITLGPRSTGFTGRLFPELSFGVFLFCLESYELDSVYFYVGLTIGFLGFLSSKFSIQAYVLIFLPSAVFFYQPLWLVFLVAFILVGAAIFPTSFIPALRLQLGHLTGYFALHKRRREIWIHLNGISLRRTLLILHNFNLKNVAKVLYLLINSNPIFAVIFRYSIFVLYLVVIFFESFVYTGFAMWAIFGWLAWLITSDGPLRILGESERYLNYVTVPVFLGLAQQGIDDFLLWGFVFYGLVYFTVELCSFYFDGYSWRKWRQDGEVLSLIKEHPEINYWLLNPVHCVGVWRMMLHGKKVFFPWVNLAEYYKQGGTEAEASYPSFSESAIIRAIIKWNIEGVVLAKEECGSEVVARIKQHGFYVANEPLSEYRVLLKEGVNGFS
ncbi:hypothetical protein OAC78_04930 [Litorivicinus sp.]|nr:hypothetical protein [Litorivicinus sp.]